jgi:hypothetical protein
MIARYAQGGMIDEVGELRANMGGEVSEARRMLQRFADGGEANQLFTDEATGESYFMVKGPDGKAYRSDRPIPGVSQGLSPEEQAAYADSLRKSQDVTALGMLQRVDALRQQEEALSPNKMEWFDQAQRLMKEDPNYQMLQRQRPELFNPVLSAVQEAQSAYQTEQAAPASQQLWESKVYQQNYGQGNVLDSVYRDPTTGYGVVSLRDPKGFVERGIVDQKGNFLVGGDYRAQDLLEDAQRLSPKFSENISSLLKSQGITPGVNDTFFDFQPYQQVTGEGTARTDTPFAQPVPTTTLLKDIPRTSPYQTQVDRMQELYENLSKRLEGVKGEPGSPLTPGYTEKTEKTASQLLGDLDGVDQESSSVVLGSTTTSQPITLSPTTALPPLQEVFVKPTAPLPEAPPVALTAGQEGLDPSTAIVEATPVENRVARVTETAINKIPESERVKIPQLDTEFRASAPRTATYDRFGRITGYNYSPAAKLTPATGTNVFKWTPPSVTSRPRSLLNIGDVPGVMVDPVTGQTRLPLSASQQFARDRSTLDNQFRQLYARAAAGDKSLPAQAPTSAAAAFRDFVMSGEDPMLQNKLRFRDIEQQKYDPTKADPALRAQYGQSAFASDLAAAFDPFLARNRAALTSLAEQQTPKSYSEMYPDIAEAYAKLKSEDKAKFPTLRDYELYHFDTYGRKEGRTSPLLGMGALQSPYATAFFSKGGEASTEDFIKKQSGGDVSRGTLPPKRASTLEGYGEGDEAEYARKSAREIFRALVGMDPYDKTNPTEAYRIASTVTPLTLIGGGIKGIKGAGKGLSRAEQEANLARFLEPSKVKERLYHGSHKPAIVEFQTGRMLKEKQYPGNTIESWAVDNRDAVFLTPDPKLADSFAGSDFHIGMGYTPATYPVRVQVKNPWDYDNPEHIENVINAYKEKYPLKRTKDGVSSEESMRHHRFETAMRELPLREKANWSGIEKADVQEIIRDLGHDGFFVKEGGVKNLGVYDPRRIKSDLGNEGTYDITNPDINKAKGGEVSTKDFIAKFANGSPNPDEVPSVIDEREEIRSESQRMLNRLASQSKLPPGLQRTIQGARARQGESLIPAAVPARDVMAGMFGAQAMNPGSEAYRTGQALANSPPVEVLKAPAKIASAAGDAATALASLGGAGVGAVRPYGKGTILAGINLPGNRSVDSSLDTYLREGRNAAYGSASDIDKIDAIQKFFDTKARRYMTTQLGTEKDPVFNAIKEKRISNLALHDKPGLRQYAIEAAREGKFKTDKETGKPVLDQFGRPIFYPKDPTAVIDVTAGYDEMVDIKPVSMKPGLVKQKYNQSDEAFRAEVERVKEQMRQAFEAEGLDPRLMNMKDPMILTTTRDKGEPYHSGFMSGMDDFIAAKLSGDPEAMKDVPENVLRALDQNEILYDVSTKGPLREILDPENIAEYLATLNSKEIEKLRFEDAVVRAAKFNEEKLNRQFEGERIKALVESGKAPDSVFAKGVSKPLLQFGEGEPHPGFAWKRLEEVNATIPEGAYVGHSVGGYALGGIGYTANHVKGFKDGTHKIYSLRDSRNRPVTTVQVIDQGTLDAPYRVVKQIKGNGAKTGNTAPVDYDKEVYDLLTQVVKPDAINESDRYLTPLLIQYRDSLAANRQRP